MKKAYIESDNIITSLGFTTEENLDAFKNMISGLQLISESPDFTNSFFGSLINKQKFESIVEKYSIPEGYTFFEKLCIVSISQALSKVSFNYKGEGTLFILSTTKGNIELLDKTKEKQFPKDRTLLWKTAEIIADYFQFKNTPLVISNACISGVVAINVAARMIEQEKYEHVIVVGADILSEFVVSGFQSFKSLSTTPCKPFDIHRDGLSLGEGVGTVIISNEADKKRQQQIEIVSGSSSNDANHISGPSRTGEGLYIAITKTLEQAKERNISSIGFISCHGTATPFNDEMEAIAFDRAGLTGIPITGLKGFIGHTLGAAGLIESIAAYHSLLQGLVYGTPGFSESGVSKPVLVYSESKPLEANACLKVASGFGGCNAAVIFAKK